jgi:hypothetical protein
VSTERAGVDDPPPADAVQRTGGTGRAVAVPQSLPQSSRNGPGICDGDYKRQSPCSPRIAACRGRGLRQPTNGSPAGFGYKPWTYAASGGAPSRARRRGADGARARAGDDSRMWDPHWDPLIARHRTLCLETAGLRPLAIRAGPGLVGGQNRDILDAVGSKRSGIVDASLGGPVALELALTRCRR